MRDTGPTRKKVDGDPEASIAQMGAARVQLGILKNGMKLGGLTSGTRSIVLEDGTQITVSSVNGQDSISVNAPAATPATPTPQVHIEPPPPYVLPPDVPPPLGNTEVYSQPYSSAVLLGAVTDKTTSTVFLAYAAPNFDQTFSIYQQTIANQSQLVQLDSALKEIGRATVAMPDWGGQLTYDTATDSFFMNTFTPVDTSQQTTRDWFDPVANSQPPNYLPTRGLIQISKAGAQSVVLDALFTDADEIWESTTFGNAQFAFGWTQTARNPAGGVKYEFPVVLWGETNGGYGLDGHGTYQYSQNYPLSQPCTHGVIAMMYRGAGGEGGFVGEGPFYTDETLWDGYAFLWDTRAQAVVWRGAELGTYWGTWDPLLGWLPPARYDPWAHITPSGNAVVSVVGELTAVQSGSTPLSIGTPPAGIVDIVVTNGDKAAYGITTTGAFAYNNGNWAPIPLDGAPIAVLHDSVTNAVAIVMGDGSGAWILNGTTRQGQAVPTFKLAFSSAPVKDPTRIYPQQFINGTLLITYALPWDGTRGVSGPYVFTLTTEHPGTSDPDLFYQYPYGAPDAQRAMNAHYWAGQRPPAWRAQMGRPAHDAWAYDFAIDGTVDPVQWIIGRYDIGTLK